MRDVCSKCSLAFLAFAIILLVSACSFVSACKAGFKNSPPDLEEANLVGTWETQYTKQSIDRLQLRADGTFKQTYEEHTEKPYVFETPWNEWQMERLPGGLMRVHLKGARYFLASPAIQAGGLYDPFAGEFLHPVKELVLGVRMTCDGELILHHMWTGSDRGFALFGGEAEYFRRIEDP
jgi:hypothetical protein